MRILKKRRGKAGFTIIEMLVCCLIIALLGAVLVTGISLSTKAYEVFTVQANGALVSQTVNTALGDVLRSSVVAVDGSFRSAKYGIEGASITELVFVDDASGCLAYTDFTGRVCSIVSPDGCLGYRVTDFSLSYDEADSLFSGSFTIAEHTIDFTYRSING